MNPNDMPGYALPSYESVVTTAPPSYPMPGPGSYGPYGSYAGNPASGQLPNNGSSFGGELIISEIVKSISTDKTFNRETVAKIIKTIAGSIAAKYAIENAGKIINYPLDIFHGVMHHLYQLKSYFKFIWQYWRGKYVMNVYTKHYSPGPYYAHPDAKPYLISLECNNQVYRPFGAVDDSFITATSDGMFINFNSILISITSPQRFKEIVNAFLISSDKVVEVDVINEPPPNLPSFCKNNKRYTYETCKYRQLGDMIEEYVSLNKAIDRENGTTVMFCFSGKPGTGKSLFGYYLQTRKICDRIVRINLLKENFKTREFNSIVKSVNGGMGANNVIIIEELDRYFDQLVDEKMMSHDFNALRDFKESEHLDRMMTDQKTSALANKVSNFINTLHLLADGDLLDGNNIVIINSNNLESIFERITSYGIKSTIVDALRSRIQVIEFEYPTYTEACNIIYDMYSKQNKGYTLAEVRDAVPQDLNISMRDLDAKIIQAYGSLDRLQTLLVDAKSIEVEAGLITTIFPDEAGPPEGNSYRQLMGRVSEMTGGKMNGGGRRFDPKYSDIIEETQPVFPQGHPYHWSDK